MTARFPVRASKSTSTQAGRRAASRSKTAAGVSRGRSGASWAGRSEGGLEGGLGSLGRRMSIQALESRGFAEEDQLDDSGLAIPVLGDDQLGPTLVLLLVGVVHLVPIDEADHVGVLFDGVVDENVSGDEIVRPRHRQVEHLLAPLRLVGEIGR